MRVWYAMNSGWMQELVNGGFNDLSVFRGTMNTVVL